MADKLAKEGREKEQPPSHLSYREVKTLIHNKKKVIFHCKTGEYYNPNQDTLNQLSRHQQTTIFRLRTVHCRLSSHLKRIGIKTGLRSMPQWRGRPNTRILPTVLLTPSASKAADMAHLCVPQNQALGVCRGFVPDIQICGTHRREDLVNPTINIERRRRRRRTCNSGNLLCQKSDNQLTWTLRYLEASIEKKCLTLTLKLV